MLYRRSFSISYYSYVWKRVLSDTQTLYNKYSFNSLGNGKEFTPFFVMCCKMAALHADCKLGTEKKIAKYE